MTLKNMKQKKLHEIELWTGINSKISLCCIIFWECVWRVSIKYEIDDYSKTMPRLTNNQGIILCPNCIITSLCKN